MKSHGGVETVRELVDSFAVPERRMEVYARLDEIGSEALPAVREGLRHDDWQVRRWCAIYLDHHADPESLEHLVALLHDPKSAVRMWAVHSVACDRCKPYENPVDVVPLLIERVETDESIPVRRMATTMLAYGAPDRRAVSVFEALLDGESDGKLRLHATAGLDRCREAGF